MPDKRLNVAIVGCGWVSDWHVRDGLAHLPQAFRILACCDPNEQRRNAFGDRYNIERRVSDIDSILAFEDIDVVAICTPPSTHYSLILQALEAGKHVVCEKPLTESLQLTDRIIEAERHSRGRVMPVFQYRFGDGIAKVRHVIQAGLAGKAFVASVETAKSRGPDYYAAVWRGRFATELGGVLLTQSIHNHDLLLWLLGSVNSVSCAKTTRVNPIEVEDCAVAGLTFADGSLASLTATLGSARQLVRFRLCFENVTFEREAFDESSSSPGDEPWTVIPRNRDLAAQITAKMDEVPTARRGFARQYELFYHALGTDSALPVTLADARRSLELVTAMFQSAETGRAESLPIGPGHPKYDGWAPQPSR